MFVASVMLCSSRGLRNKSATFGLSQRAAVVMSLTDGLLADVVDRTGTL